MHGTWKHGAGVSDGDGSQKPTMAATVQGAAPEAQGWMLRRYYSLPSNSVGGGILGCEGAMFFHIQFFANSDGGAAECRELSRGKRRD